MAYTITPDAGAKINLAPGSLAEEVTQNLTMILSTLKNTVPLDRDFGLSARFLDKSTPVAEAVLVSEILDAIETYEPRAEVLGISFERNDGTGKLIPRLEVEIKDGGE
jgi:phage baseplate assembly protein W